MSDDERARFREENKEALRDACKYGGTLSLSGVVIAGAGTLAGTGSLAAAFLAATIFGVIPVVATGIGYSYLASRPETKISDNGSVAAVSRSPT